MLLQVVTDARNVGGDFDAGTQADTRDLAQRGVRLPRGGGVNAGADTTTLRRALEGGSLVLADLVGAALADQLLNCWHLLVSLSCLDGYPWLAAVPKEHPGSPFP